MAKFSFSKILKNSHVPPSPVDLWEYIYIMLYLYMFICLYVYIYKVPTIVKNLMFKSCDIHVGGGFHQNYLEIDFIVVSDKGE